MRRWLNAGEVAWDVSDLRGRFRPKSRFPSGLAEAAPWINLVLLVVFFSYLNAAFVLQPGIVVNLPEAPFVEGTHYGPAVIVLSMHETSGGPDREIAFFDDKPYVVDDPRRMEVFQRALSETAAKDPAAALVVEADEKVKHGTVARILDMAREAGIRRANFATRPGSARGGRKTE